MNIRKFIQQQVQNNPNKVYLHSQDQRVMMKALRYERSDLTKGCYDRVKAE
jgi:hypothetical protein